MKSTPLVSNDTFSTRPPFSFPPTPPSSSPSLGLAPVGQVNQHLYTALTHLPFCCFRQGVGPGSCLVFTPELRSFAQFCYEPLPDLRPVRIDKEGDATLRRTGRINVQPRLIGVCVRRVPARPYPL